jgi:16S rRNA (cytidine1402-2'-O)-methyltransferase
VTGGSLTLVATPLGNLGDITHRALDVLRAADVIACEDTRRTAGLLTHFGIDRPRLVVVNDHTEPGQIGPLIEALAAGKNVALVSDAGSPGISDPGERLVQAAIAAGYTVSAAPGPSAAVMAISISGLPAGRWVFEGFLPRSGGGRTARLGALTGEQRTVVLYEAPHRLAQTLGQLAAICGADRAVVLARELTKLHEEVWRGTLATAVAHSAAVEPRGEYVIVLAGASPAGPSTDADVVEALEARLAAGLDRKTAVAEVAAELQVAKRQVYSLALSLK